MTNGMGQVPLLFLGIALTLRSFPKEIYSGLKDRSGEDKDSESREWV